MTCNLEMFVSNTSRMHNKFVFIMIICQQFSIFQELGYVSVADEFFMEVSNYLNFILNFIKKTCL